MTNGLETGRKRWALPALWILLPLTLLLLVNTIIYFMLREGGDAVKTAGQTGHSVYRAARPEQDELLVSTMDNRLLLMDQREMLYETAFENSIRAIGISPEGDSIYAGCADKTVYILDRELKKKGEFTVNGQVMNLQVMTDGSLLVVYGIGEYSDKYYVGRFTAAGEAVYTMKTGFTTRALDYIGEEAYFGTDDSRVGAVSKDGKEMWRKMLKRPVTRLTAIKEQKLLLVSDEVGSVYMMDTSGKLLWSRQLSEYPIRSVYWNGSENMAVAGDDNGVLYVLDRQGGKVYESRLSKEGVVEILPSAGKRLLLVMHDGQLLELNLHTVLRSGTFDMLKNIRLTGSIVLAAAFIVLLVLAVEPLRRKAAWTGRQLYKSRLAYLLLLPTFALLIVFNYYPALTAVFYSFTDFSLSKPIEFIGLENYGKMLEDSYFWVGVANLVKIIITSLLKDLTMPLLVAELVFWLRSEQHKYLFRTAFVVPSIVPGIVTVLLWKMMYDPNIGLINNLLDTLGLEALKQTWLGDEKLAIWSIIFAGFPWISVFAFLVYFGGLINISRDIYDSADIDGIGVWSRFWKIDIPMIVPQLKLIIFFSYIGAIQSYGNIWVFTQGGPGNATYVPALQMFIQISKGANFGYASALGVVLFVFILAGSVLNLRYKGRSQ